MRSSASAIRPCLRRDAASCVGAAGAGPFGVFATSLLIAFSPFGSNTATPQHEKSDWSFSEVTGDLGGIEAITVSTPSLGAHQDKIIRLCVSIELLGRLLLDPV